MSDKLGFEQSPALKRMKKASSDVVMFLFVVHASGLGKSVFSGSLSCLCFP